MFLYFYKKNIKLQMFPIATFYFRHFYFMQPWLWYILIYELNNQMSEQMLRLILVTLTVLTHR